MKMLFACVAAAGLALAAPAMAAEPDPAATAAQADAAKKAAEEAAAKAATDAMKAAEAAKAAPGVPVPNELPVIKKTELDGGLIVEDLKIGEGSEVKPGGFVVAHYHGTLKTDGTVFDSSFERGEPIGFPLNGVIQGWQKGVPGMKVGGVRRLIVPAAMAYGADSPSEKIPANSDLVFVIQLVDLFSFEDKVVGTGEAVTQNAVVVTAHTIKGADGKVIETVTRENPYIWVPGEHQGVSMGLDGMKVGGTRTMTIPAQMNRANPRFPSTRPQDVPVTVEVEVIAVRNFGAAPARR